MMLQVVSIVFPCFPISALLLHVACIHVFFPTHIICAYDFQNQRGMGFICFLRDEERHANQRSIPQPFHVQIWQMKRNCLDRKHPFCFPYQGVPILRVLLQQHTTKC